MQIMSLIGRRRYVSIRASVCAAALVCAVLCTAARHAALLAATQFEVTLDPAAAQQPITGRLYVFVSQRNEGQPMTGPNWFSPEPFFGLEVKDFAPGESRTVDDRADGFPDVLSKLPPGRYRVQAVLDHNLDTQHHARGPGNLYSDVHEVELGRQDQAVKLPLSRVIAERQFPESQWVKEVKLRSPLLSKFLHREVVVKCGVVLPPSYYNQPQKRYPVVYLIPGFGGSHFEALRYARAPPPVGEGEVEFIRVNLSGQCKWGHHVYADSATNGPRGRSLVDELIPYIDAQFRTVASSSGRFVSGHSSGGWSSLWLQVTYPEAFGGVWSVSPDPVDFRDFQRVNLYSNPPPSLYTDEQGRRRPIARRGDTPLLWFESFGKMDDVIGRGGQLRSFEAVFSPLGEDGLPRMLWDRKTGRIDPAVATAWEAYDIRLKLQRNWKELGPKLQGKLHIITGSLDTFYLEGAVRLLGETLKELGSDAEVTIIDGADHGSLLTPELYARMRRQMSEKYRAGGP
jgi:pimeloyl-ACP methyl ester carboxylesterase